MEMSIADIHCHILPQWDDGSQSLEQSLDMARMAVESGVTVMAATPHCIHGGGKDILDRHRFLCEALAECEIPLRLMSGMEILGTEDTAGLLQSGELLTLNGTRYPLIEFSFSSDSWEIAQILQGVVRAGFCPVVAHPERYDCVRDEPRCVRPWLEMGCLLQINRGSLLGRFGMRAQDAGLYLIEQGFATAVASDAHGVGSRTPWMADVFSFLSEEFSPNTARMLLHTNPMYILQNEQTLPVSPA